MYLECRGGQKRGGRMDTPLAVQRVAACAAGLGPGFIMGQSPTRGTQRESEEQRRDPRAITSGRSMTNNNISARINVTNPEDDSAVSNDTSTAIGALILSLVFLLGVPGNFFIVWSILARTRRRSVTTLLILNLACADGFLMVLTIFFIIYLAKQTWIFGNAMCKCIFYLCNSNMYASIFLITLMSVHRLVAVVFPRRVSTMVSRKVVRRVLVAMWLLVWIMSIPSLVFRSVRAVQDENNKTKIVCSPNHVQPRHVRFQYSFETVSGFILPYAIIITCYVLILKRLRQTKFQRRVRSENLILAIVVTFGIFWLPYHIINMTQVAAEWYKDGSKTKNFLENIYQNCRAITSALAFISSCANPVLYTFAGKSYIKKSGLAFMAQLFEGTSQDQTGTRKTRGAGKEDVGLRSLSNNNGTALAENGTNS